MWRYLHLPVPFIDERKVKEYCGGWRRWVAKTAHMWWDEGRRGVQGDREGEGTARGTVSAGGRRWVARAGCMGWYEGRGRHNRGERGEGKKRWRWSLLEGGGGW